MMCDLDSRCECIPGLVLDACTWIGYCNSAINPIIYAYTIKDFKQNVQTMLRPWMLCSDKEKPLRGIHRLQQQYNVNPALSPAQMAKLLAGHVDHARQETVVSRLSKTKPKHDINNWAKQSIIKSTDATASVHHVNGRSEISQDNVERINSVFEANNEDSDDDEANTLVVMRNQSALVAYEEECPLEQTTSPNISDRSPSHLSLKLFCTTYETSL